MDTTDLGTLYVLANRDQSLAKIGLTRNGTPDARADDYARAHGIQWHVYWSARTLNVAAAEANAHRDLQAQRFALTPDAREVFHVTPERAQRVAARYVIPPPGEQPELRTARPAWRVWLARAAAVLVVILAYWPELRRLHRRLRATLRAGRY
jgi:hypothetical protein